MIIIPIGAESSVALKPKVTITLIVINIVVFLISVPVSINSEKQLLKLEARLYAKLIELYALEHRYDKASDNLYSGDGDAIGDLSRSKTPDEFRQNYIRALSLHGLSPETLSSYEKTISERDESFYYDKGDKLLQAFIDWKILKDKEETLIAADINYFFGLIPSRMDRVYTFITHMFLHGGLLHLIGNMIFLWVVGCLLEDSWGRMHFALFYLAGGVLAGLIHCLQDTQASIPLIGASGAIAATMGAFAIRHFMTKIKFFYFFLILFRPFWGTFSLPAFVFLPFWLFEQVMLKHLSDSTGGSGVAYMAHIGGFLGGFMYAAMLNITGIEKKVIAPRVEREHIKTGASKDPRFIEACNLIRDGSVEKAKVLFGSLIREYPHDIEMMEDIALIYRENGLLREFKSLMEKNIKFLMLNGRYEEAASMMLNYSIDTQKIATPQQILKVAKWLSARERYQDSYMLYRSVINSGEADMNIIGKAYTDIITILVWKMNRIREALQMCEEWKKLPMDQFWKNQVSMVEEKISDMAGVINARK